MDEKRDTMKIFVVQRTLRNESREIEFVENEGIFLTLDAAKKHICEDMCEWKIEEYKTVDGQKYLVFGGVHFRDANGWNFQ